jgi:hypothetical protein
MMTTLDQMAKAAYEANGPYGPDANHFGWLWENLPELDQDNWRRVAQAAVEIRDAQWLVALGKLQDKDFWQTGAPEGCGIDYWIEKVKPDVLSEVKPDAVTDPNMPIMHNYEYKPPTCCSAERGHFKRPDGKECYCGALIYNGNQISLRRRQ